MELRHVLIMLVMLGGCAPLKAVMREGPIVDTPVQATAQCKAQPAFATCPAMQIGTVPVGQGSAN